jgi:hypothetical protein
MIRKLSLVFEGLLFLGAVVILYLLALLVFPLFRESFGLWVQLYEDGVLPFSTVGWVFSSALLFSLSGAIMMHWMPTASVRTLGGFWTAAFILYWVDPVVGTMGISGGGAIAGAVVLGTLLLILFFWLLASLGPERNLHFQPVTWRSRMASGWLIVWMGFFTGTSAVLLSEIPLYPLRRGLLSLGALAMAAWSYALSASLRKAQGEEEDGVASTWRWLLLAWGLLALLHYFFRVRVGF